jgi:hypothetical protein
MRRKRILLTGVGEQLTESAEKKLEQKESYQTPTCSNGKTSQWYEDIGIPIPPDLVQKLKEQDQGIELEDEDYEEVHSEIMVYIDQIKFIVSDDEATTIFLKDDLRITVLETVEDIDFFLDYLERSEITKLKDLFSMFFAKIFGRFKKE